VYVRVVWLPAHRARAWHRMTSSTNGLMYVCPARGSAVCHVAQEPFEPSKDGRMCTLQDYLDTALAKPAVKARHAPPCMHHMR
jgi:hypothetical protein